MKAPSQFRKNTFSLIFAFLTAALLSPGSVSAEEEVTTWRVQSHWPAGEPAYKSSLVRIKNVIEERTDGRLKLNLHGAGALFKAPEIFNAVSRGVIEMGTILPAYAQDKMTLAAIASGLPFSFREPWEAAYFHKQLGFEEMLREEASKHGIYYSSDRVYPVRLVLKKPVNSMDDFSSAKLRSSGAMQTFLSDAGAAVSYIPGPELYPALDSGVVDGAHWGGISGAEGMNLFEIAKYVVDPALTNSSTDALIINQEALDALPDDVRGIVVQALDEHFWYRTNEYQYQERTALARVMDEHGVQITTLPDDVQQRLTKVAEKMWDKSADRSDLSQEAVKRMKAFLRELGYL